MNNVQTDLPTLISSIFYLMSRYANSQDKQLILAIHEHLMFLEQHPDTQSELVKTTCKRLRSHWLHLLNKDISATKLEEKPEIPAKYSKLSFLH
ncbi:MAG: hypothetical protein NMNS01_02900 [Nitrosomonas sp.]|jgi:hypothetical protein|nr:MAG: hypothetical protein NMNS01_02900 [Nitrosomonas sp.]